jgi:hypothetical protein
MADVSWQDLVAELFVVCVYFAPRYCWRKICPDFCCVAPTARLSFFRQRAATRAGIIAQIQAEDCLGRLLAVCMLMRSLSTRLVVENGWGAA